MPSSKKPVKKARTSLDEASVKSTDDESDPDLRRKNSLDSENDLDAGAASDNSDEEQLSQIQQSQMPIHKDDEGHLSGAIKKLVLKNFMNHVNTLAQFGRNINFITGVNGSGKSAVLTALTVVLGGQVRSTGRKELIRMGQDMGEITVTISNEGGDAFKPDSYGSTVVIQRTLRKSGANSWKTMRGDSMTTVKTSAAEVRAIVDHFNFQVDNPIAVLNQEMTKKFMQSSSKRDKYDFFEKGTKIDEIKTNYRETSHNTTRISKGTTEQQENVDQLEAIAAEIEREYDEALKLQEMEDEVKRYEALGAWCHVFELEDHKEQTEAELAKALKDQVEREKKRSQYAERIAGYQAEITTREKEAAEHNTRVEVLMKQTTMLAEARKKRSKVEQKRKRIEKDLQANQRILDDLEKQIVTVKSTAAQESEQKRRTREANIQNLEAELAEYDKQESDATNALYRCRDEVNDFEGDIQSAQAAVAATKRKVTDARSDLKAVQGGSKDRVAPYGPDIKRLHAAINTDKGWTGHQPVGPLGIHIQPKDPKWIPAIEFNIGANLRNFVVENHADRSRLHGLIQKHCKGRKPAIILKRAEARYVIRDRVDMSRLNPEEAVLCEDAIDVDNDQVYNVLVDNARIHQAALFMDDSKCKQWTDSDPKNLYQSYTVRRGRAIPTFDGTRARWYVDNAKRSTVLAKDMSALVKEREIYLKEAESRQKEADRDLKEFQKRAKTAKDDIRAYEKKAADAKKKLSRVEAKLRVLRNEDIDEENVDGEVSQLQDTVMETQGEIQAAESALAEEMSREMELRKTEQPLEREAAQAREEVEELSKQVEEKEKEVEAAKEGKARNQNKMAREEKTLKKIDSEIKEREMDLQVQNDRIVLEVSKCGEAEFARPDRADVKKRGKDSKWYELKVAKLRQQLEKKRDEGDSLDAVAMKLKAAREQWQVADMEHQEDLQLVELLQETLEERKHGLKSFQQYIGLKARQNFKSLVKNRGFSGKLVINHSRREVDILVDTTGKAMDAKGEGKEQLREYQSVVGLSGGEKSFSNACFVSSMWEAMDCPLRCMDEYDVYMDAMNRTVTTKMLIEIAKKQPERQFVFLSPLGMKTIQKMKESHKITVIGMVPQSQMQGQSILNDHFAAAAN